MRRTAGQPESRAIFQKPLFHFTMSDHEFNIFIVDDDPISRHVLKSFLKDSGYPVTEFGSGESILTTQHNLTGLVLMDVEMPGLNGIETCRRLRDMVDNQIRFIFISAHDNMETRIKAYDAGGSDYICKPYSRAELIRKVKVAEEEFHRHQGIMLQAEVAQQAAFSAISSLGETGILFDFLRKSHLAESLDQLAIAIRQAIKEFGLGILLELRHQGEKRCYSNNPECSPLEQAILEHARGKGRMAWVKECLVVNYDQISMVVSGFDLDDDALLGRQRDHLSFIAEASNARLAHLDRDGGDKSAVFQEEIVDLYMTLHQVEQSQLQHIDQALGTCEGYMAHLAVILADLDLDELQKLALKDEAQRVVRQVNEYLQKESMLNEQVAEVVARLGKVSKGF
jgi:CheY-like chemotaxis protein